MSFKARVKRFFAGMRSSASSGSANNPTRLAWPCAISFVFFTVLSYAAIANCIPIGWISFGQAMVLSVAFGACAAGATAYFIMTAAFALRRAFIFAATLTLVATIGYGLSFSLKIDGVPSDLSVESVPLQGGSLAGAVAILLIILAAFLAEKWIDQP